MGRTPIYNILVKTVNKVYKVPSPGLVEESYYYIIPHLTHAVCGLGLHVTVAAERGFYQV